MILKRIFIIGLLLVQIVYGQDKTKLPVFSAIHAKDDADRFLQQGLPQNGTVMLIFYDPGCGHCQELGHSIDKNANALINTEVFFITMYDSELVDGYINMFAPGLKNKKNISFWHDPGTEFIEKLDPQNYPATYIYDAKNKTLQKDFQGENDFLNMLPYLAN